MDDITSGSPSSTLGGAPSGGWSLATRALEGWLRILPTPEGATCSWWRAPLRRSGREGARAPVCRGAADGVDIEEAVPLARTRRIYRQAQIADGSFRVQGMGRFDQSASRAGPGGG
jgi:hypothetical protein